MKKWLDVNDILMIRLMIQGKSVIDERFIKNLRNKIYEKMIANVFVNY